MDGCVVVTSPLWFCSTLDVNCQNVEVLNRSKPLLLLLLLLLIYYYYCYYIIIIIVVIIIIIIIISSSSSSLNVGE